MFFGSDLDLGNRQPCARQPWTGGSEGPNRSQERPFQGQVRDFLALWAKNFLTSFLTSPAQDQLVRGCCSYGEDAGAADEHGLLVLLARDLLQRAGVPDAGEWWGWMCGQLPTY